MHSSSSCSHPLLCPLSLIPFFATPVQAAAVGASPATNPTTQHEVDNVSKITGESMPGGSSEEDSSASAHSAVAGEPLTDRTVTNMSRSKSRLENDGWVGVGGGARTGVARGRGGDYWVEGSAFAMPADELFSHRILEEGDCGPIVPELNAVAEGSAQSDGADSADGSLKVCWEGQCTVENGTAGEKTNLFVRL